MRRLLTSLIRPMIPAALRRRLRRIFVRDWLRGDYSTWAAARADSAGYDAAGELARYAAAARAVENGRGAWERDVHVFPEPAVNAPLLSALRAAAARHDGRLDVVDFGGALGSTWRQHRAALADLTAVRWRVVEQPAWVEAGRREFANDALSFHLSLTEAAVDPARQVAMFSCSLQYLESPATALTEVRQHGFAEVILERVSHWDGPRDRLAVQHTPADLGGGSYPCWVFRRDELVEAMGAGYTLAGEWESFGDVAAWVRFRSLHFIRAAGR